MIWAFKRDLTLALRAKSELALTVVFFVLVMALFPLGIGPDNKTLLLIAPGVAWIAALLSNLLALPKVFASDFQDGTLEQICLSKESLPLVCFGKVAAHWISTGLSLSLLSVIAGLQFGLSAFETVLLVVSLGLGSISFAWLGAIGAALTLNSKNGPALLALLVLPLCMPVLIFGASIIGNHQAGLGVEANFSVLGAIALLSCALGPWACAAAVKISVQ